MNATGLFGTMAAVIGLAAFSVAVINGGKTAQVIGAAANGFANVINAATHPGSTVKVY